MTEDERKYVDILQSAISRMAANSFQLKGWSVALGTVIIGLTAKDAQPQLAVLTLLPAAVFCYLDAYYLGLERGFRDLYDRYTQGTNKPALFSMKGLKEKKSVFKSLRSPSVWAVHGIIMLVAVAVTVWGVSCKNGSCPFLSPVPAATTAATAPASPAAAGSTVPAKP